MEHGLLYDTDAKDYSKLTRFRIIDKGQGKVILQCEDGRYVFCAGYGIAGDVRLTADESKAEVFLWQDYLNHEFMLMSMRTHKYIGKSPTTVSPYSMDFWYRVDTVPLAYQSFHLQGHRRYFGYEL